MKVIEKNNGFIELLDAICLIKSSFFPICKSSKSYYKYSFYLGIGGNKNNTKKIFEHFFLKLSKDKRFFICESSVILKNKAFGFEKQNDFLNSVLFIQTSLCPNEVLKIMNHYEKIFKRVRIFKNAPRTLDLDILYFDSRILKSQKLNIPHTGVNDRISVILPIGLMK